MPRSDEAQWWYDAVYSAVQQVPYGRCTSYGHIARLLDQPQRSRQVGVCLKYLPAFDPAAPDRHFYHDENVPWQRVVNTKGGISPRGDGGTGVNRQVQRLRGEGITVNDQAAGIAEPWVDLGRCGWFPNALPGEEEEEEEEEEEDDDEMDISVFKEMLGEDLDDINDEDDEEDEWDEYDDTPYTAPSNLSDLQILPLSQASLPKICYLVIDRSAELIVKPLAEFADLGAIPDAETDQRTLPVFDNHRIAKRFSHRRERVIKVPDGRMLQKTSNHLQDKGITRLLIDGQIYSLSQ